jgi:hypothetical protein
LRVATNAGSAVSRTFSPNQQRGWVEMFQGSGHDHLFWLGAWSARFVCLLALEILPV